MRIDHEYVSMADYESDTKELVDAGLAAWEMERDAHEETKRVLLSAVSAAGEIRISKDCLLNQNSVHIFYDPATDEMVLKAIKK